MILGICGSRHFGRVHRDRDFRTFCSVADAVRGALPCIDGIVSGGERNKFTGVDTFARMYAESLGIPFTEFPASAETGTWKERFHKRDRKVALMADTLLAIPCQHSRGTWITVRAFDAVHSHSASIVNVDCETGLVFQVSLATALHQLSLRKSA